MDPAVTVMIAGRNRPDDLRRTLTELRRQRGHSELEIIVYDDASDPPLAGLLSDAFDEVDWRRSDERVGPTELRKRIMASARGRYILSLDDDSWPEADDAAERIIALMDARPEIGILSMAVRTDAEGLYPPPGLPVEYETHDYIGCGAVFRKAMLERAGLYEPLFFRQGEERDLALRCIDAGFIICQRNDLVAYHLYSPVERDHEFIHSVALRNELLHIALRYPWYVAGYHLLVTTAAHVRFCVRKRWWRALARGLLGFVWHLPGVLVRRRAVHMASLQEYLALRAQTLRRIDERR